MDEDTDQPQMLVNSPVHIIHDTINEDTAFTDQPLDGEDVQSPSAVEIDWDTSIVSEVRMYMLVLVFNSRFDFFLDMS